MSHADLKKHHPQHAADIQRVLDAVATAEPTVFARTLAVKTALKANIDASTDLAHGFEGLALFVANRPLIEALIAG